MGHLLTVWVTHLGVRAWLCLHKDGGCRAGWEGECSRPSSLGEMGRGLKPLAERQR